MYISFRYTSTKETAGLINEELVHLNRSCQYGRLYLLFLLTGCLCCLPSYGCWLSCSWLLCCWVCAIVFFAVVVVCAIVFFVFNVLLFLLLLSVLLFLFSLFLISHCFYCWFCMCYCFLFCLLLFLMSV